MFKNLISPVQSWLLGQGKCVGCSRDLSKLKRVGSKITCKCKRVYVEENGKFRRARLEEV